MANILVVDDEPKMTSLICGELEDHSHQVTTTVNPAKALELIRNHSYDIVITDLSMPEISGMRVLEKALQKENTAVIMMTAFGSIENAVEAMKKGATDYLLKPFSLEELILSVDGILKKQQTESLSRHYQQEINKQTGSTYIGDSPVAEKVKQLITKVAPSDATVLLTGRSGTGKEVAARMLHNLSRRSDKPFIAVNCSALTESLLESEIFGHEKGSFTGAVAQKRGRFELANTGTIFLDEIGEISTGLQSKLLRVLEEKTFIRVGGVDNIAIDVRVIAATNRDLKTELEKGNFREDLYFRLNVFPIEMPNLSERKDDLKNLAEFFLRSNNYPDQNLSSDVLNLFQQYDWPGNVRELRNVLERAMILAGGEILTVNDFSLDVEDKPLEGNFVNQSGLENTEKKMILDALEKTNGNKTEAAKLLKITRRRLYSRMKIHNIK
ncbi:MAG: sigma-54 dependent transcriptional regulator [bacterium]